MKGGTMLLKIAYRLVENSKKSGNLSGFLWIGNTRTKRTYQAKNEFRGVIDSREIMGKLGRWGIRYGSNRKLP